MRDGVISRTAIRSALGALCACAVLVVVAACGSSGGSGGGGGSSSGPPQGPVKSVAAFGVGSPQTSPFDQGGFTGLQQAASNLNAKPTWLSNISFDQSSQVIQRLAKSGTQVIISNGSGFADSMLAAAQQYPKTWFWVYADLASTKGLPNVVGIRLNWEQMGYMAGAFACMASPAKKVGLVVAQPIPAYTHAVGGAVQGVKATCGKSSDLLTAWSGTFSDNVTTKQATEALIAKGAQVIFDFQDAATVGVQSAVKEHPNVKYVSAESNANANLPKQIVVSIVPQYQAGYAATAKLLASKQLRSNIYLSGVQNGGFELTSFENVPPSVAKQGNALFESIKTGKTVVPYTFAVSH
jgi:basic membrane lipoprotein Med (substrate-binding protein (PBP1-ABC) superfamily)